MALLTPLGLARLLPSCAASVANALADVGGLLGDRAAARLLDDASARPDNLAAVLDDWFLARLTTVRATRSMEMFAAAARHLRSGSRVFQVADNVGITRRHLSRLINDHVGLGPKELSDLYRLDRSLNAVQSGWSGVDGYSDQAHQIRDWRRRLKTTPGLYARTGPSALAEALGNVDPSATYYL